MGAEEQLSLWCRRGHEMTAADNTYPGRSGEPLCTECLHEHLAAVREWRRQHHDSASTTNNEGAR